MVDKCNIAIATVEAGNVVIKHVLTIPASQLCFYISCLLHIPQVCFDCGNDDMRSMLQTFREAWKGMSFTVDRVCFISRVGFLDPYVIRHTVGLGQGLSSPVREVNVPYVATVGPDGSHQTDGLVGLRPY